ncbi:hypothetical protein HanXRQr2_Chr16g0774881 [Helianthus annuus]|uniref:Uncharacterized protein n=1 Tax=Helianthus annuus TaxID=4232 RepID=A0A9K3H0R5_HELAN|nr:hypothetical protein HanXRQr2_Chr16g0774881 [Helianthus annuus]KAJ0823406.1 hypothetical protein HanPSC8_Chr16g0743301 [Helianthus annuus]
MGIQILDKIAKVIHLDSRIGYTCIHLLKRKGPGSHFPITLWFNMESVCEALVLPIHKLSSNHLEHNRVVFLVH